MQPEPEREPNQFVNPLRFLTISGAALLLASCGNVQNKKLQSANLQRGVGLFKACKVYEVEVGAFPQKLSELVESKTISADEYEELKFMSSGSGETMEWKYFPDRPGSGYVRVLLVSPVELGGHFVVIHDDGTGKIVPSEEVKSMLKPE